jgi:photosystem II stability/assembly factor-like uncharacterized protein
VQSPRRPPRLCRSAPLVYSLCLLCLPALSIAQAPDSTVFHELHYRMIGPFRGGRTVAAVGIPDQPNVFYIGVNNGGVWKTIDYGTVWTPIFDDQPTGSIGAIAIAPSNPNVIYVGSGEGLQRPDLSTGDGIYKSTDAGTTWTHLGLRDGQQIPQIIVDPKDPNRVFVAVLGHPYGPNPERGIYRSTDGGQTFERVLYKDDDTGGMDVAFDPADPRTVYAVLWAARQAPWEVGSSWTLSERNGVFKSTDGGSTWRRLGKGLPGAKDGLGRIGIGTCASLPTRLYAVVGADKGGGVYRSDDAGENWYLVNNDVRLWGRDGDFNEVRIDPTNANVVYVANIVTWKSTDGGQTFTGWRGAPGGDDYHRLWINPNDPNIVLDAADQGAVITVDGGRTWSTWYNQPTAQFYHVSTDNAFPYRVCGGQQESGSACIASRGNDGEITFRDWHPVGVEEYGYVAPDPLDPDIVYGGKVSRYDRRTGQVQDVAPRALREGDYRVVRTEPLLFSPVNPRVMYFASNQVWKTADGGQHWTAISPDLTRPPSQAPANLGSFTSLDPEKGEHRGVVYTLAPSPLDSNLLWAGTDDGLIQVTRDGGTTWTDVTPASLRARPWAKISLMEASHSDPHTAYAAVNTFRLDDLMPHIYRTRDGGQTWQEIVNGLPAGAIVNAVREDPTRQGLLFCGTELAVYVSFDDGDHWQSLRLNMPATSIRDLVIKDEDLVIGTHGRSFWILDDITPIRQATADVWSATGYLFRPAPAYRVRWNMNTDTPLPPDEPTGENPPDGAIIDYYLGPSASGPVTLEILDAAGTLVRRYASTEAPEPPLTGQQVPDYWPRPPQVLSAAPGLHRFVWDLRYPRPAGVRLGYPIAAIAHNTPAEPRGVWVLPGQYTVRLTVNGQTSSAPLTVRMDPRVTTSDADLRSQFQVATRISAGLGHAAAVRDTLRDVRRSVANVRSRASRPLATQLDSLDAQLSRLERNPAGDDLSQIIGALGSLYREVESADLAPTAAQVAATDDRMGALDKVLAAWGTARQEVSRLDGQLRAAGLSGLVGGGQ